MLYFLLAAGIVWGLQTIYFAYRFREYRKFLAGAFFVSWGTYFISILRTCRYRSRARISSLLQRAAARALSPIHFLRALLVLRFFLEVEKIALIGRVPSAISTF